MSIRSTFIYLSALKPSQGSAPPRVYTLASAQLLAALGSLALPIALALSVSISVTVNDARATKLTAPPLPSKKDLANQGVDTDEGVKVDIPENGTRWHRKPDAREEERLKKEKATDDAKKAADAQKQAVDNALKARQGQVDAYKQQVQMSVEENNKAVAFGKTNHWMEAIQCHEKAIQYDPRNKQFRINLSAARTAYGQQLLAKGDTATAINLFRTALVAAPDNGLAGKCLVQALKKAGYDPSDPAARIKLGDQLAEANDLQGAYVEYNAAMQLDSSARSYIKMGDIMYRFQQIPQAANYFQQAIIKDPDCGAAHRQIGFLKMAMKDYTGAAASLRKAVILDSKDSAAGAALVELWRKQVATAPSVAENHLGLAGALQLTNDFVGAESEYRKVQSIDPNNTEIDMGMASLKKSMEHQSAEKKKLAAETFLSQGLKREALVEITQAVTLEPRNASYQFMYGQCLESAGDYRDAYRAYMTCVLIDPQNNVEAAARAKHIQEMSINSSQAAQATSQAATSLNQYAAPVQAPPQAAAPQAIAAPPPPAVSAPVAAMDAAPSAKNMFESGPGAPSVPNNQLAFRTHDESPAAAAQAAQASTSGVSSNNPFANAAKIPPTAASNLQDLLAKIKESEDQKDYKTAIEIMHQLLPVNMKNPALHHRLAMDLVGAGDLPEAISEFRLASALAPTKKEYVEDLNRAMQMHKQKMNAQEISEPPAGLSDGLSISGLNDMGASK
jgi:tetratricopeptide (TPR) repeat protein